MPGNFCTAKSSFILGFATLLFVYLFIYVQAGHKEGKIGAFIKHFHDYLFSVFKNDFLSKSQLLN